jgi:MFS family permease
VTETLASTPAGGSGPGQADPTARPGPVLLALVFVVLSYGLMQTMLVPTVGALQRELRTTAAAASWAVLSATLLASAVLTPVVGRLGDRFGKRRVLRFCLGIYLVGTVGAALAPGVGVLIGFRPVQGISLALLPLSFALVRELLPADRVPFGLALTSGLVGGAAGAGLLMGGVLVDHVSWRWIFVVGAVLIVAAWVLTEAFVPPDSPGSPGRPDLPGVKALTVGLVALLLGITEGPSWGWCSVGVLGLFGLAAVALLGFGVIERRTADPLIDLGLLARRPAAGGLLLAVWHGQLGQVVLCYLVASVGYGFAMAALPRLVNQASPVEHSGSANGVNTVARVLGGAIGSQLGAAVLTGAGGFGAAFGLAAGVAAVGGVLALFAGARG